VSSGGDMDDLYLMSLCKHFVIANSTYSWWAAYFAEDKGGLIVCPKEWVTLGDVVSPCPGRWINVPRAVRALTVNSEAIELVEKEIQKNVFDEAIRNWFANRGDQTFRVNIDYLNADSVVFDLGGYLGDWTHEMHVRYQSRIYTFEPIKQFADKISQRFTGIDTIRVCNFGLGTVNEHIEFVLSADGTGAFNNNKELIEINNNKELIEIKEIQSFLASEQIMEIDLIKINIEGAEFDLLNHIVDTGLIQKINKIQVQFHDFVPDAIRRREILIRKLSLTHRQNWCYYFVWEEWEIV
jgi:FkbM family methyltransferase